jgi:hypothetical protein
MSYGRNAHKVFSARYELAQGHRVVVVSPTIEQARKLAEAIDPRCGYIGLNDGKPLLGANPRSNVRDRDQWYTPAAVFDSIASFRNVSVALPESDNDRRVELSDVGARVCVDVLLDVERYGFGGQPT